MNSRIQLAILSLSYTRTLPGRGSLGPESRYSWYIDFAAGRETARGEMQPLLDRAAMARASGVDLKDRLRRLKKEEASKARLEMVEAQIREQEIAARDLQAQAAAIDAAVFDQKAVNPNATLEVDTRFPAQIIENIQRNGCRIVADALARLSSLLESSDEKRVSTARRE